MTKNEMKLVRSLSLKKFRDEHHLFVAEGRKIVTDLSTAFRCEMLIVTESQAEVSKQVDCAPVYVVSPADLKRLSQQKSPQGVMGVFNKKRLDNKPLSTKAADSLILALDGIQDPGNLGTIIRLADWFGIERIIASKDTADAFSPKVVQASMGALARVSVDYMDLETTLLNLSKKMNIWGTFLEGENIYKVESLAEPGVLVMGNEGNGIRPEVEGLITGKIFIPNYPSERSTSESLNVAVATAVACSEIRRRQAF